MNDRPFSLRPFPSADPPLPLKVTGYIARRSNTLAIGFALLGPLEELAIPALSDLPARKDGLWEETCFEFFLGVKNSGGYWEFNLSPAGHWNVYRFAAYRQGMEEETALTSLPFSVENRPDALRLTLELDLERIVPSDQALEAAVSAVLKPKVGEATYWALTHPRPQADFHWREGFILDL